MRALVASPAVLAVLTVGCAGPAPLSFDVVVDPDTVSVTPLLRSPARCAREPLGDGVCVVAGDAPADCSDVAALADIASVSVARALADGAPVDCATTEFATMDMAQFREFAGGSLPLAAGGSTLIVDARGSVARVDLRAPAAPVVNAATVSDTEISVDADGASLFSFCAGTPRASRCCTSASSTEPSSRTGCDGRSAAALAGPVVHEAGFGQVRVWARAAAVLQPPPQCI